MIEEIKSNIEKTLNFLREGNAEEAKAFFNQSVSKIIEEKLVEDEKYFQLRMFLVELDDYLNDKAVQIVGSTNLEELEKSYSELVF